MRAMSLTAVLLLLVAGSAAQQPADSDVSRLRIKPRTVVDAGVLHLRDVLDFAAADPQLTAAVADRPLLAEPVAPGTLTIGYGQIARRLSELGVNPARVLLGGALQCRVTIEQPAAQEPPAFSAGPLLRERAPAAGGATSLAEVLRERIAAELADLGGEVEVEFERAGWQFLELTTPPFDFVISPRRGARLGLREYRVTIRRDGRRQRSVNIGVRVKLLREVLVAARPLNVGTCVTRDALQFAPREFTSTDELGLTEPERLIGQQVRRFVPAGRMIREADIKSVDLVKRSQPVTVIGGGSISIRVLGDALDSGGYGDTVRVRLGDSRRSRRIVRGVVTGVGTVKLVEGSL